jgi:hypothetical protein
MKIDLVAELYSALDLNEPVAVRQRFLERKRALMRKLAEPDIPEHLKGLDPRTDVLKILLPSDIYSILSMGIYHASRTGDMQVLNDAFFSYNRLKLEKDKFYCHPDRSLYMVNVMECLAGNDMASVTRMLDPASGPSVNGHRFTITAANLVMGLLLNDPERKNMAEEAARGFLQKKNGRFENAMVNYLVSLSRNDVAGASNHLSEACIVYNNCKWLHDFQNPFLKVFGAFPHGMYNLAFHVLNRETFDKLHLPDHQVFWKDYAMYCIANDFSHGKPYIVFDQELEGLNCIYNDN